MLILGVYVSKFPDVVLPFAIPARDTKYLMVFKVAKVKMRVHVVVGYWSYSYQCNKIFDIFFSN